MSHPMAEWYSSKEPTEERYDISGQSTPKAAKGKPSLPLVKDGPHLQILHTWVQSTFLWVSYTVSSEKLWGQRQEMHGRVPRRDTARSRPPESGTTS